MQTIETLEKPIQKEENRSIQTEDKYLEEARKIMKHHKPGSETIEELNQEDSLLKFIYEKMEERKERYINYESEIRAFGNLPVAHDGELVMPDEYKTRKEKLMDKFHKIASFISQKFNIFNTDEMEWFKNTLIEIVETNKGAELLKKEIEARRGKEFVNAYDMLNTLNITFDEKLGKYVLNSHMN